MFAAIARRYDLNNRLHSFGRDQAWRRKAVALCGIQPTDDVLDVACGTGDLTLAFAKARPRSVTGLDFTVEMLDIARRKAPGISFVQGDAMSLPFGDGSFDVVAIAWGIRNVADPSAALREFRRVLRPGGRLCGTATLIARDHSGAYRYLPRSVTDFAQGSAFASMVEQAGFPVPTMHVLTFGVCTIYLACLE
jgi:demethylmenaquinone methyltransferase/2-methoxy-6-polyprenyl-1,4-benzoquinol methylase